MAIFTLGNVSVEAETTTEAQQLAEAAFLAQFEDAEAGQAALAAALAAIEGEVASIGARQWFVDNQAARQLFTLSIAELEAEINSLVDALFPGATATNRTRTKRFWMALAVSVRVLFKREL